jgi:hypothetical protein
MLANFLKLLIGQGFFLLDPINLVMVMLCSVYRASGECYDRAKKF